MFRRLTSPQHTIVTKKLCAWEENVDRDAIRLFDDDRIRFLNCFRDFLENPKIPYEVKREAVSKTRVVLAQLAILIQGSNRSAG